MFKKKYQILIVFLFICFSARAEEKKDASVKSDAGVYDPVNKKILPLPRYLLLPTVTYSRAPDIEGEFSLDFSKHRYWFIALIASWNQRSSDIAKIFNSHSDDFKTRNIGVLGLFAQNTEVEVGKWREKNKPLFETFFASRNFLDSVKNPKMPMVWFIGEKGEILLKIELPTVHQIDASVEKALTLTGF
ncbi:MAG: hypothetical protein V4591_09460 [Bdellovibrionota bacterium]